MITLIYKEVVTARDLNSLNLGTTVFPEMGLLPKQQAELADILVEKYKDKDVTIRTTSEYLLRKLQLLTTRGIIEAGDVEIIYDATPEYGDQQIKTVRIDKDGYLTDSIPMVYAVADEIAFDIWNTNVSKRGIQD